MSDLTVDVDGHALAATWTDDDPDLRAAITDALPVEGRATRWGDELYLPVPVEVEPATTCEAVPAGAVAYWPAGPALCLFWGPTPASRGDEPRAAGPVAVVARVEDVGPLQSVAGDANVRFGV